MSRTAIYKGIYFGLFFAYGAIGLWAIEYFRFSPIAILTVFMALLLPGRILGFFWRDLLRGLRLLNSGEYAESKRHSERFLLDLQSKPWLKKLILLGSSSYSRDPEALALNNLGTAEFRMGDFISAREHLRHAIEIDSRCPLPYFNMGALLKATGDIEQAERWFEEAARRGFTQGITDKIVTASQSRFSRTDGPGRSR